ncbi:MAG: multidrug efflux RND transporter permease subunit [Mucilaginibacter polytrichastri]|nr:multidrug efflux RND transporter permease subunit [Mucilaginibacter polytrichastri]
MISDTFIRRPVTAIVIAIVLVLVGILALINLPIGQFPEITPPTVNITATFTGADAQTIEQTVATPIEVQVNGTPGMTYLQSNSTSSGQMSMTANFEVGTDIDVATLDVQNRVSVAEPVVPEEVRRIGIVTRKRNPSILLLVALYSPKGTHGAEFLDNYTNIFIKDALLRVKGVGDVFTRADDFSMRIWLNPDKMAQLGLTSNEVVAALQEQNVQVGAGSVGGPPQNSVQAFEYSVQVKGRLANKQEFENVIIRSNPQTKSVVYLKDIARVQLGKFNYSNNSYVDGKRAAYLLCYQTPGSNAIETADGIYAAMDELKKKFPSDLDYVIPFESVTVVKVSIEEVVHTLVEALILVIIVVFLFLQSWRATLIPVLAIPVSIIATFVFFIPLGFTVNTLTLFGFVLAIGIVVDDAIVVVEAVQHLIDEEGMTAKEATHKAMEEITAPVIAIALILAAVFIPVGFAPGIVGRLYQQFAITIAISVLISAFVALTLTPALCSLMLKPMKLDKNSKGLDRFFYKFNTWFGRVTSRYSIGVRKAIKNARYVIILLVCICVGTILLFRTKSSGFLPLEDEGRLIITFELPDASSTTRTVDVITRMMDTLKNTPGINHYAGLAGLNAINFSQKSNSGTIFCQLKPWDERDMKSTEIAGILQKKFASIKEASIVVIPPPSIPGLGNTAGFSFILQEREAGGDIKNFDAQLQSFLGAVNKRPEIAGAFTFFNAKTPNYYLSVDRAKAKQLGVSLTDVFSTMQTYLGSRYINDFTLYGRNFRVVAQADTVFRQNIQNLKQYYVRNQAGTMVPLSALVNYKLTESASVITHFNLFRSAEINGNAAPGYSSGDAIEALREVAAQTLPQGYGYEFSALSREEVAAGSSTTFIFSLSIIFVFLFLAALYESWSVPFSVLLAVPLGAFGAIGFLSIFPSLNNNVYAQIGLITLIGLAAKNAILIVEFAKERLEQGMELVTATLQAVKLRLRPIVMTSLAFILGVVPLTLASGAGAVARQTLGWTVVGGMLSATLLAIFIVPVLYVGITRIAYGKKKLNEMREAFADKSSHKGKDHHRPNDSEPY